MHERVTTMSFPTKLIPHIQDVSIALAVVHEEFDRAGSYYTVGIIARAGVIEPAYTRRMLEILVSRGFARKRTQAGLIVNGDDASEVYRIAQSYVRMRPVDFARHVVDTLSSEATDDANQQD